MLRRISLLVIVAVVALGVLAAPALADAHGPGVALPTAFLGVDFPSVKSIVRDVVKFFFGTLLDALVPPFLRDAALGALKWLIAVPNPADRRVWPTVGTLADDLKYVGIGLLPLTFTLSALRYWVGGLAGRDEHAGTAVVRTAGACAGVVVYSWAFFQAVAAINVVTNAILSFPVVAHGLQRTVGLLFGGALLTGDSVFLAVLGICAVVLATGLFAMKVALMILFALWYVTGAFLLALSPLPEAHAFWRVWKFGLAALAAIPIGWCILFALSGAFALDVTGAGLGTGGLGSKLVGAFATLIVFYLALRWPMIVLGQLKSRLGPGFSAGGSSGGGSSGRSRVDTATVARAKLARASFAGGHAVMSRLPAGGLVGLGTRAGRAVAPRAAALASRMPGASAAAAAAAPAASAVATRAGAVRDRGRVTRAAGVTAALQGDRAPAVVAAAAEAAMHAPSARTGRAARGGAGPASGSRPGRARQTPATDRRQAPSPTVAGAPGGVPESASRGAGRASAGQSRGTSPPPGGERRSVRTTVRDAGQGKPSGSSRQGRDVSRPAPAPGGAGPQGRGLAASTHPETDAQRVREAGATPPTPARPAAEAASRPGRPRKPRGPAPRPGAGGTAEGGERP